jgi:hypothetical protein
MFFRNVLRNSAFAGTVAVSLWAGLAVASAESPSPVEDQAQYAPKQSIRYDFGSKSVSGYFLDKVGTCVAMLMVFEQTDPEKSLPPSAARVRLVLLPGQIAGLDSEEGQSLNFTCGEGAARLLVDIGERERLVELQARILRKTAAD